MGFFLQFIVNKHVGYIMSVFGVEIAKILGCIRQVQEVL